ncbi:MAG: sensor histidine kinase, partial [Thiomicrorhabdus sp.]|nr:sensor histidine kinase [Thiomicrorhabdus sp.]
LQSAMHTITADYLLTRLSHDADNIERNLNYESGEWSLNLDGISAIYSSLYSGHYFVVITPKQRFYSPSLDKYPLYAKRLDVKPNAQGQFTKKTVHYEAPGPVEELVLIYRVELNKEGQPIQIYVAEDLSLIQNMLVKFDVFFSVLTLLTLVSLYFLLRWLLQRTFRQLTPLEEALRAFQLGHKINLMPESYPLEVRSLIEGLNLALAQSTLQFEKSRQLNGNLSHSLKTPLNLIFQLIDAPELQAFPKLKAQLQSQSNIILSLIERELKMDRIAHHQSIVAIPFISLWQDLQPTFEQLYRDKNIQFITDISECDLLNMEKEDAFELLGNLIDNACKWCDGQVYITFKDNLLVIEDNGVGATDVQLKHLEDRGYRTDETKPGHGIGLSIVKGIVAAYQAKLSFSHSKHGGLKVTIQFKA